MNEVLKLIPVGNESRITSAEICMRLGITGAEVRNAIHKLRLANNPIGSDTNGYWIATEPDELNRTISSLNSRISQMIAVRESLKKSQTMMNKEAVA